MRISFVLPGVIAVLFASGAQVSAEGESQEAFRWFEELGFPKITADSRFVRVSTGQWYQPLGKPPQNQFIHGFLIESRTNSFDVWTLDFDLKTYTPTVPDTVAHKRVAFEVTDLKRYVTKRLDSLSGVNSSARSLRMDHRFSTGVELFLLGYACDVQGHSDQASDLCKRAKKELAKRHNRGPLGLIPRLSKEFASARTWRAVEQFGDPKITRSELLTEFKEVARLFPESEHAERVRETVSLLQKMIEEDQHHEAAQKSFEELTEQEKIAELIFQLRDQNGHQWSQPGACDIFNDERKEKSPASQLVILGFAAVPQLIESLGDQRFTRSVGFHRDFYFSHHVLRVGDCAETIIGRIAGRGFYRRKHTNGAMLKDGVSNDVEAQIRKWWKDVQQKGEQQVLAEAVAGGDLNAARQAQRLTSEYPKAAFAAIKAGIAACENEYVRAELIQQVATLHVDDVEPLLTKLMEHAPDLRGRTEAALQLYRRDNSAPVPAMLEAWKKRVSSAAGQEVVHLVWFFAEAHSQEAIRQIKTDLPRLPTRVRYEIISTLGDTSRRHAKDRPKDVTGQIESLLISALSDVDQYQSLSGTRYGQSYTDPRICDFAALMLANNFSGYKFDIEAGLSERDAQLSQLKITYDQK